MCVLLEDRYPFLHAYARAFGWTFLGMCLLVPIGLWFCIVMSVGTSLYKDYRDTVRRERVGWIGRIAFAVWFLVAYILWVSSSNDLVALVFTVAGGLEALLIIAYRRLRTRHRKL